MVVDNPDGQIVTSVAEREGETARGHAAAGEYG